MEAFPRRTENRVEGEVVLWGNRRILCLKIFARLQMVVQATTRMCARLRLCAAVIWLKGKRLKGIFGGGAVYYVQGKGQGLGDGGQLVIEDAS